MASMVRAAVVRKEDPALLTGRGRYVDDIQLGRSGQRARGAGRRGAGPLRESRMTTQSHPDFLLHARAAAQRAKAHQPISTSVAPGRAAARRRRSPPPAA
jgi:hypothetical protein